MIHLRAAIAALSLVATSAMADEASAAIDAYLAVCPAALLAPDALPARLDTAGLRRDISVPVGSMTTTGYVSADGSVTVSVTTLKFSDAIRRSCVVGVLVPLTFAALTELRARLEADPVVGPLEGRILPMPGGIVTAYLKRPGLDPLVGVTLTATASVASLVMDSWTPVQP